MAITASSIVPSNNLEDFRQEFNNLVVDVTAVAATNTFDASIIFEGATADAYETTLTVTDPTADRTITLPNVTGTVLTTANSDSPATTTSSGDADFVLVDDGGVMKKITKSNLGVGTPTTITLAATNTTDAAHYPLFSSAATGDEEPRTDTGLTYNPNSEILHVGKITLDDAGTLGSASDTDAIAISSGGDVSLTQSLSLLDQEKVILGTNSDISLSYDETTTDSLVISSDVNDAALGIILQADAGADAGDEWKLNVANAGVLTLGNDIASAGTHVTLYTISPNSTAASTTHDFVGKVTAAQVSSDTFGVPITMNRSAGGGTDANDNIVQNTQADDGDRLLYEDAVFDTSVLLSSHGVTLSHQRMDTTGAASAGISALTDGVIIAADFGAASNFSVTLAGNRTLSAENLVAGQTGSIFITQDGTGSRTLSFASYFHFPGGTAPTMTATAAAVDRIDYAVASATSIHAVVSLDVKATG